MAPLRTFGRSLIAPMFITGGLDNLRSPSPKVEAADKVVGAIPVDTDVLIRVNGAVQLTGGLLLAAGRLPRLAGLALAGSLIPTTLAGHRFWEEDDERARAMQRVHFLKNLAMLGGLLASISEGREEEPSRPAARGALSAMATVVPLVARARRAAPEMIGHLKEMHPVEAVQHKLAS